MNLFIFYVKGENFAYECSDCNVSHSDQIDKEISINELSDKSESINKDVEKLVNNRNEIKEGLEDFSFDNNDTLFRNNTSNNENYSLYYLNETINDETIQEIEKIDEKIYNSTENPRSGLSFVENSTLTNSFELIENNSLGLNEENNFSYINIENLSQERIEESSVQEKVKLICFENSEEYIEGEVNKNIGCSRIKKEEIQEKNTKYIIIKSEEHIEDPLTIYTKIPEVTEKEKNNIRVLWKNKRKIQ